jgi:parallel beta-helix repeat protein
MAHLATALLLRGNVIESLESRLLFAAPGVVGFTLINADTNRPVAGYQWLTDGATIDLAALPTRNLSIRANTRGRFRSVAFSMDDGALVATEDRKPFYIAGNTKRDVHPWTPAEGTHTLTATPYRRLLASGAAGTAGDVTFTVVDATVAPPPPGQTPAPVGAGVYRVVDPAGDIRSIGAAVHQARPGDVVLIEPGTYHETIDLRRSGTADAPITLAARTPGTVTLDGTGLPYVLGGTASHIRIQSLTINHCANDLATGAVRVASGWNLTDVVVQNTDGAGILVYGAGVTLTRVTAQSNGQQGVGGSNCSDVLLKDCITRNNNTGMADPVWKGSEHAIEINGKWFVDPLWEAGAGKWTRTRRVTLDGVQSYGNGGPGVWFDYENADVVVRNSSVHDNHSVRTEFEATGINIELTAGGTLLENNTVFDNPGGNIVLESSRNVTARGNTVRGSFVGLNDWFRGDAYTMRNITFTGNRFEETSVRTGGPGWSAASVRHKAIKFDENTYASAPLPVFRWGEVALATLHDVRDALGLEINGVVG